MPLRAESAQSLPSVVANGAVAQSDGGASNGATAEPKRRDRSYTTGEMARLSNNTLRTVRFYEEAGILRPIGRTEGGHRLFEPSELDRLMLVSDMREAGMSLEEIRHLLETKQQAASGQEAARTAIDSLRKSMDELKRKVDVLTRLHLDLAQTVESAVALPRLQTPRAVPEQLQATVKRSSGINPPLARCASSGRSRRRCARPRTVSRTAPVRSRPFPTETERTWLRAEEEGASRSRRSRPGARHAMKAVWACETE